MLTMSFYVGHPLLYPNLFAQFFFEMSVKIQLDICPPTWNSMPQLEGNRKSVKVMIYEIQRECSTMHL